MTDTDRWLLPDGIGEVLPPLAWRIEEARRSVLDLYRSKGYDLVIPPYIEYLESLLTGMGSDLELETFKITDQLTGRMMGVRADMTPQMARIDAHSFASDEPRRLCYSGSVLRTRSENLLSSRSPIQTGAELYGCSDLAGDIEITCLMLETLRHMGIKIVHLDFGHVGIYRELISMIDLDAETEKAVFQLLQSKSRTELEQTLSSKLVEKNSRAQDWLVQLTEFHGDETVLAAARQAYADAPDGILNAIESIEKLCAAVREHFPEVEYYFDLAELRGYQYHTGLVYTLYVPGYGQAIMKGGRYDLIGQVFGRGRAATGFSYDLKALVDLLPGE